MLLRPAASSPRRLEDLLGAVPGLRVRGELAGVAATGCTHDSRAVQPGDVYAALPGAHHHGASFAAEALDRGAVAVLTDDDGSARVDGAPLLLAERPRDVLGAVASWVHGDPSKDLTVLGVTGTNGKTTTAFLLEAGLQAAGLSTGLLGTVVTRIGTTELPKTWITNPEASDLHAVFALMREQGVRAVAMEVSSHALALGRVDGVRFSTATFTNLSQDHLEFHSTMADYYAAKASLFTPERSDRAVVCVDDEAGRRLHAETAIPSVSYGENGDWRPVDVVLGPGGSSFRAVGPDVDVPVSVRLPGAFNVANALGALVTLVQSGVDAVSAARGIGDLPGVPGRMERIDEGQPFSALVDYAHTPAAVTSLLRTVRDLTPGRVIVVLGCGGDRDPSKRPLMGRAAADGADVAVLTSDNPRSEDPSAILAQMAQPSATVEPDRRAAIRLAVSLARSGDTVVVAGKGHETGQEVDGVVSPFDDRVELRAALQGR